MQEVIFYIVTVERTVAIISAMFAVYADCNGVNGYDDNGCGGGDDQRSTNQRAPGHPRYYILYDISYHL